MALGPWARVQRRSRLGSPCNRGAVPEGLGRAFEDRVPFAFLLFSATAAPPVRRGHRAGPPAHAQRHWTQPLQGGALRWRHVALTSVTPLLLQRKHQRPLTSMNESPGGMQPPPVWPPSPDALRPSPFPHPALHALHTLARALLFPSYWLLDQLLLYLAPYPQPRPCSRSVLRAIASSIVVLLLLASLPLALPSLLLWLLLQAWRRPFCYQPPPHCWTPPAPWRPRDEPARCFGFLSANVCLLPNGPARFNNLQHSQQRATAVGTVLLAHLQGSCYGATGCSPQALGTLGGALTSKVPAGLDFVCLQEVFDLRASRRLVRSLAPHLGPVLYDVGTFGLQSGPYLKLLSSGLLLASRYPLLRAAFRAFPDARQEDALASKGLLSAQAQLGFLDRRRIVGFLHCTHLVAQREDGPLRCKQMTQLLEWVKQFEAESRQSDEEVAFSVFLGDLNFDNCSPENALEQEHPLFCHFRDPCRLGVRQDQPWALGTLLNTSTLHHSVACSPEMLYKALEQEEGRHHYMAGPLGGDHPSKSWRGRRLDYIMYREMPRSSLSPEVEQVTFSTALAGLTDHLAVGLRLRVSTTA
ncbi:sphingomyelin phosphodiesterase 5 [Erinaceus europaeus]|uniref:sphingomyelin phosphodiesterase n=1 Tax=Erinaceus europaeus TaxID=9365 RepID=A0A1S2Z9X4_ERIEU|nr:sphingomyelin phosphodiesterase 5 [Erinaceus europaeus]